MQLESTLKQFPLSDLLAMMSGSGVTGALEVGGGPVSGRLFCADGRVYHAAAGGRTGLAAIYQIVTMSELPFRFVAGERCGEETLGHAPDALVALVRHAERLHLRAHQYVPDATWVAHLSPISAGVRLHRGLWPLVALIDGQRSVLELADRLGWSPLEASAALSELIARGMVILAPPAPPAPPAPAPATFFDRLMSGQLAARRARRPAPPRPSPFVSRLLGAC